MNFSKFKKDFIKILPAAVLVLLILSATIGYSLYKKWQGGEGRPSYVPAPTNVPPLNPALAPEPTEVAPLKPSEIPKPTNIPPLGSEIK